MSTQDVRPVIRKVGRPIFPDGYGVPETDEGILDWDFVDERMSPAANYWVVSVRPDGRPHAMPVWGVWLDGKLYFEGSTKTRRARNIAVNPNVVVHLEDGNQVVVIEGQARDIGKPPQELAEKLSVAYCKKYGSMGYEPGPDAWDQGGLHEVLPEVVYAWKNFPKDATRWKF